MATINGNTINNITSSIKVKAKYSPHVYTLKFVINGGTTSLASDSTTYTYDTSYTLPTPTRSGYTFKGWYVSPNFLGDAIGVVSNITKDTTYYAKWSVNTYEVAYNVGSNTNANFNFVGKNVKKFTIEDLPFQLMEPTSDGFNFTGWTKVLNSDSQFNNTPASPVTEITEIGNVTLYSNWTPKYANVFEKIYLKASDGKYDLYKETTTSGLVGTTYTTTAITDLTGFSENTGSATNGGTITINSNPNNNVIDRYFDRTTFTITYNNTLTNLSVPTETYSYNENPITLTTPSSNDKYSFAGYVNATTKNSISTIGVHNTNNILVNATWTQLPFSESLIKKTHTLSGCAFDLSNVPVDSAQVIEYSVNSGDWADLPDSKTIEVESISEDEELTYASTYALFRFKAMDMFGASSVVKVEAKCLSESITIGTTDDRAIKITPETSTDSKDGAITILSERPVEYLYESNTIVSITTGTKFSGLSSSEYLKFRFAETNRHIASDWVSVSCENKDSQDAPSTTGVTLTDAAYKGACGSLTLANSYSLSGHASSDADGTNSGGSLQYSLNNGVTWNNITSSSGTDVTTVSSTISIGSVVLLRYASNDTCFESAWTTVGTVGIMSYTVSFDVNADNYPTNTDEDSTSNDDTSLVAQTVVGGYFPTQPTKPSRYGYSFAFWSTDSSANNTEESSKDFFSTSAGYGNSGVTSNTKLYAIWERNTINYDDSVIRYVNPSNNWNSLNVIDANKKTSTFSYGTDNNTFDVTTTVLTNIEETIIESLYESYRGYALSAYTNGNGNTISYSYDGKSWVDAFSNDESNVLDVTNNQITIGHATNPSTIEIDDNTLYVARQLALTTDSSTAIAYNQTITAAWTDEDNAQFTITNSSDDPVLYYTTTVDEINNNIELQLWFVNNGLGKDYTAVSNSASQNEITISVENSNLLSGTTFTIIAHGCYNHRYTTRDKVQITEVEASISDVLASTSTTGIVLNDGWSVSVLE